jgi:hypothetical protein
VSSTLRTGALVALTAAAALLDHPIAEARWLDSTVVVGRVTSNGRAVQGVSISVAGRATSTTSASDGRYALTVARAGQRDRVTLLARAIGYQPWQRALDLAGDTIRVDIALKQSTAMLEEVVVTNAPQARQEASRVAEGRRADVTGATASVGIAAAAPAATMA